MQTPTPEPAEVLDLDQEQEWDAHRSIIAAVTKVLPDADVEVRREMRSHRKPSFGCTVKTVSYVAELDGRHFIRRDSLDALKAAVVTKARDIATERKLELDRAAWDCANVGERFDGQS